ncbi:hypothetical protein K461DRAFT_27470 [Myriangium duriaei CBS 260.36]|uniref:Myb-like DNA-binding domain-containing protein n=1 Tax=Myriangium duriaei CBS 260.36 TaxID=1168546 RepID=A0A9P4JE54_9PEZI|nr:hypothetical protein K461DRAFT_27470 [Myriangium duriaei CBS 260.36]
MAPRDPATAEDQVKFLCVVIKHMGSKADFAEVAKELNIVTGAAAYKRFQRIFKANNVTLPRRNSPLKAEPKDDDEVTSLASPSSGRTAGGVAKPEAKKRKTGPAAGGKARAAKKVKKEVKQEEEPDESLDSDDSSVDGVTIHPESDGGVKLEPDAGHGAGSGYFEN